MIIYRNQSKLWNAPEPTETLQDVARRYSLQASILCFTRVIIAADESNEHGLS